MRYRRQKRQDFLESKKIVCEEDEQTAMLFEVAASGLANPTIRSSELLAVMYGTNQYARTVGDICLFITLTAPPCYHSQTIVWRECRRTRSHSIAPILGKEAKEVRFAADTGNFCAFIIAQGGAGKRKDERVLSLYKMPADANNIWGEQRTIIAGLRNTKIIKNSELLIPRLLWQHADVTIYGRSVSSSSISSSTWLESSFTLHDSGRVLPGGIRSK